MSFSLNYTTARLAFSSAQLGAFPPGTYFFVNTSQTNVGRLGVTVALPAGVTFPPGTQLLAGVTFDAAIWLSVAPTTTIVSFGDLPMVRGLTDVNALTLAATYTSGTVTLGPNFQGGSITNFVGSGLTLVSTQQVTGLLDLRGGSTLNGNLTVHSGGRGKETPRSGRAPECPAGRRCRCPPRKHHR